MYNILMRLSFIWSGICLAYSMLFFIGALKGGIVCGIAFGIAYIVLDSLGHIFLKKIYAKIGDMLTEDNK